MSVYGARGNSSRAYLHAFLTRAGQAVEAGQLVLDAGAGRAAYRDLFAHARYETADFLAVEGKKYARPDYICDLAAIPVEDGRFDHVVLTQVLEHLPEPAEVLAELHRVLKPGGNLWLTAPLFYAEHERPYDYFRYTQFGLRHLLEAAGFTVLEVEWLEGYLGTLSYQARLMSRTLPASAAAYGGGARGLALAGAARLSRRAGRRAADVLAALDLRFKFVGAGLPKNYQAVARKPAATPPGPSGGSGSR
jgi:SAM-dependent methyltransferase